VSSTQPGPSRAARLLSLPPLRAIVVLALPTSAVMVLGATQGVVNTYFVAKLGADAIAAVSLVFPIQLILMTMMGGGIGSGVSAAVAHALGGGRHVAAEAIAEHAFLLTAILSAVLTLLFVGGAPAIFGAMGGRGAVLEGAVAYSRVLFSGVLITFSVSTFDSLLRGEGNVRVPSLWGTVSLSLQILLLPLFMFGLGLGLVGAAAATLTGQLVGSMPRAYYVFSGKSAVRPKLFPNPIRFAPVRDILRVGIPASLATLANYAGLLVLTAIVARYGTADIAAFGLGTRLDFLIITLAFGVGSGVLTLVGLAAGAADFRRVAAILRNALVLVASALALIAALLVWRPGLWMTLFTTDPQILETGAHYLRVVAPSYPFFGVSMVCSFTFQGLGRAFFPLFLVAVRSTVVIVAATALAAGHAPVGTIFLVMALGNAASSGILFLRLRALLRALHHS